jgi:phosphatidylglycerophosphate synthase
MDRRLHRPLSHWVTQAFLHTPLTATQVTILSLAFGLAAGWCFGQGTLLSGLWGLALFCLSAVLDHSDGELARATATESSLGHFLDNLSDGLVALAVVAGMTWSIAAHLPPDYLALPGWTFAAGLPLCFLFEWRLESLRAATPLPDHQRLALFRTMNTLTAREPLYTSLVVYLMVTSSEGVQAWQGLAWTFAGGIHLFWLLLVAVGWRFFGFRTMIRGLSSERNRDPEKG